MKPHPRPVTTARAVVSGMAVLGGGLTVFHGIHLDRLPVAVAQDAVGTRFDACVTFLRATSCAVAAVDMVSACGAFLTTPSCMAVSMRRSS